MISISHLNQTQDTADGNHHANKFAKNTDPDDVSLFAGKAYFPDEAEYQQYLRDLQKKPAPREEVIGLYLLRDIAGDSPMS